jgi:hypothetical protein
VKPLPGKSGQFLFQLRAREKSLLLEMLKLYPLIPADYARPSRAPTDPAVAQSRNLLEEALSDQRKTTKEMLDAFLQDAARFRKLPAGGYRLALSGTQRELLLQVLNDIRVGCWIQLGSPDELNRTSIEVTAQTAPLLMAMDACAFFQMGLLNQA